MSVFTATVEKSKAGDDHFVASLYENGEFRQWDDCKQATLEHAEAEAVSMWPFVESVNGITLNSESEAEGGIA